jgi:glycine dehydrogenase subunit 1
LLRFHPYIPNASSVMEEMLKTLGAEKLEDLFQDVPKFDFAIGDIPAQPMDEIHVKRHVEGILAKNKIYPDRCFTGGGPWFHHVPSIIRHLVSRGEFLTAYTPYQAEISQGVLQSLFEFQSMICELYDMDIANASMYDLASATGEAALLCSRVTGRKKFIVPRALARARRNVLENYTVPQGIRIEDAPFSPEDGSLDEERLKSMIGSDVAGVYVENPNYFGVVNDIKAAVDLAHEAGALVVVGSDPLSLGIFKPPGAYGADVAIGDGQPLGIEPGLGGNTLGIMACRDDPKLVRQMPGRIVGLTRTMDGGRRGFILALSTREQHIRREKATSNICTNETLFAIVAAIYLALLGRRGIAAVARRILDNTSYMTARMGRGGGASPCFKGIHFRDFAFSLERAEEVDRQLLDKGMMGGRDLAEDLPEMGGSRLFAVTEIHTKEDIDGLLDAIGGFTGGP